MADTLETMLGGTGDIVELLRNQQVGPNVYPGVPAEYSNWRAEQWAWQHTAVLYNQSYHMVDLEVRGPDAFAMLEYLAINSFKGFVPDKAKQFVPVTPYGHVIGDVILFYLEEQRFNLVGRAPSIEWVEFHAASGKWNVEVERDERWAMRTDGKRKNYRFQVQGPNAMKIIERATGIVPPDLKFFNITHLTIAGKTVHALRHGMAGQPGWELYGPWEDYGAVHAALVEAGKEYGMALVGGRAYSSNTLESGWIPSPLPAIYTGDELKPFREWLSANSYAGKCSIGGSYVPDSIEGYYLTPWDLGYGPFVKFDHDFIGRAALEKIAAGPHRKKVTLALDNEDVIRVQSSALSKGDRAKFMEYPSAVYAMHPFDEVRAEDGSLAGLSTWIGYTANEGKFLTLAMLDAKYAEPGTRVSLIWGEPNGGTSKPTVEPHVQTAIKAIVAATPYVEAARDNYADGWRTKGA
ncbi:aminomethyl transferase family protein [Novosphingobium sp.]|uniref:syringate O-demethylase n=1 Tax=Novosphingobium sp. TaxID=1874826 RepID=UPI00273304DD|nr:aminomethyl transferase family protein [Novosphingobium sp.]MDP3907450.1 aminomethyl transferase family protein [Novosphingobium sp.]